MSLYLVGDIHGCYKELKLLLRKANFNSKVDYLWVAGDLVSRGLYSLEVVRYLFSLKSRVKIVLGNHDLNLISVCSGIKKNEKKNFFEKFMLSKDGIHLVNWLRYQPVLQIDEKRKIIMSHAGISPKWDILTAKKCAKEISQILISDDYHLFLKVIHNNYSNFWSLKLNKLDRLQYSINVFTQMRYCYPDGRLNMFCKKSPAVVSYPLKPWFMIKNKIPKEYSVFFGHWSSLQGFHMPKSFFSLDTGCCWGGKISMIRWEDKKWFSQSFLKNDNIIK